MGDNRLSDTIQSLRQFSENQKTSIAELDNNIKALENSDIVHEYEQLKADFDALSKRSKELDERMKKISNENDSLKNALAGQIFNLRMATVKTSEKNLEIFFDKVENSSLNALTAFENKVKARVTALQAELNKHHSEAAAAVSEELKEVIKHLNEMLAAERAMHASKGFTEDERKRLDELKNKPLTDEQIKKAAKRNNFESFIGSNLINKIGIVMIVVGVITLLRFSTFEMANEIRSVIMLLFGAAFTVVGELMSRKRIGAFSIGCTACGIAILFSTLAVSYFSFGILSMYAAVAMCVLITAAAFFLSVRYRSQTIFTFALIGGYLPIAAIFENPNLTYGAMVYFMIMNVFALISSFKMQWRTCAFIGTVLNIIGTYCIMITRFDAIPNEPNVSEYITELIYEFAAFGIYTAIPVIYVKRSGGTFKASDVVMLAINTVFSSLLYYMSFHDCFGESSFGVLSIILTIIYAAVGYAVGRGKMRPLFIITALAFSVMIIPFQFGRAWLSLAWLAEGVLLVMYGILTDEKSFRRYGMAIYALCVFGFLVVDVMWNLDFLFIAKYTAITLSSVLIMGSYVYMNMQYRGFGRAFKYITAAAVWFYIIYISVKVSEHTKIITGGGGLLFLVLTFMLAFALLRVRAIYETGTKIMAYIFYAIGLIASLFIRCGYSEQLSTPMKILCIAIIVLVDVLCILSAMDFIGGMTKSSGRGIQWYPTVVSLYIVILTATELTMKFNLSFTHTTVTVMYAVIALAQIVIGFIYAYPYLRRFGLLLSILTAGKLFIVDLAYLSGGYKIICYFSLGAAFMAISFIYQLFEKKFVQMNVALNDNNSLSDEKTQSDDNDNSNGQEM